MSNDKVITIKNFKKNKVSRRMTNTRMEIIKCLSDGQHQHTATDIVNHLKKNKQNDINIATVYNNLKTLLEEGIIDVFPNYESKNQRYELINEENFHIHLRDFFNGKEFYLDVPDNLKKTISEIVDKQGYEVHNLEIKVLVKKK